MSSDRSQLSLFPVILGVMTDSQEKEEVAADDCIPPLVKKRRTTHNQSVSDNFQVPHEIKAIKDNRVDDNCDKFHQLMNYLPQKYTYKIDKFERIESEGFLGAPPIAFEVHLWLTIDTAIDAQTWIQQLEEKTETTYRVTKGT